MDTIHRQERKRKREGERGERERGRGREKVGDIYSSKLLDLLRGQMAHSVPLGTS